MLTMDIQSAAKLALSCMDLTSLNTDDTPEVISSLCQQAQSSSGSTAAICIYPPFIAHAKDTLKSLGASHIKVATVTNFPTGEQALEDVIAQTRNAIEAGADEVDVVFPYKALRSGDKEAGFTLVYESKKACGDKLLKVIIESGELKDPHLIEAASQIAIDAGADFIKTSTGKVPVNATLEAAEIMLRTIKSSNPDVGFKAAGGVRDTLTAKQYLELAQDIMGTDWVTPNRFRFGASGLLASLQASLGETSDEPNASDY